MKHLKDIDGEQNTVIMMQVENEIGFLNSSRDFSSLAETLFGKVAPQEICEAYGKVGTWNELFGEAADEYFMAYYYACAVEKIAKAGAIEYDLPLYVNSWLEQFPKRPGAYPSGGPIAKVMKIWRLAAPSIDLYAPDIYLPNFAEVCEEYTTDNNPSGGLVIEVSDDQIILAGIRFTAEWLPKRGENSKVDYISIEEGTFSFKSRIV